MYSLLLALGISPQHGGEPQTPTPQRGRIPWTALTNKKGRSLQTPYTDDEGGENPTESLAGPQTKAPAPLPIGEALQAPSETPQTIPGCPPRGCTCTHSPPARRTQQPCSSAHGQTDQQTEPALACEAALFRNGPSTQGHQGQKDTERSTCMLLNYPVI